MNIYEQRLVTITIDKFHAPTCERIRWVMDRWGKQNFKQEPAEWNGFILNFKFWVNLHPVDASRAIDEIWSAAQGTLDITKLVPIR